MILAVPEYSSAPAAPAQWDRYYNTSDDKLYIQTVAVGSPTYPAWVEIEEGAAVRESMRREITLTRSKYSAKDYQTFLDATIAYIAERWGDSFNDFMSSDAAMMIAEYVAAAFDQMSWYLDREIDDHYMELARVASNVARLARYLGYKPTASVAASADLTVTLPDGPYSFDVPLRAGHQFEGPNGLIFELGTDQVISASETEKEDLGVYQGQTYVEVFTSDGTPNQTFDLSLVPGDEYLAQQKTYLTVDLDEWTEEDYLPYGQLDVYEISYLTSPPKLKFGDGVIGKIPPDGAEIRVSYVATKGKSATLATSGTITTSLTTVVVNFQEIPIEVTNPITASGGADSESLESIKAEAPRYFLAAERLVTKGDYEALAGQFSSISGAVAKANAIIVRGVEDDLELQALMDAVVANRVALDSYLDTIETNQDDIKAKTGDTGTADTIRYEVEAAKGKNTDIRSKTDQIDTQVGVVKGHISDCRDNIDLARTRLAFLPYQHMIGQGDGLATVFSSFLPMVPIREGSVTVLVGSQDEEKSGTDGDCDTTPGRLRATVVPVFSSDDVGKLIRIGGEYRQIQKYVGTSEIEYSGPRIYGTDLLVDVYEPAVVGYDDGAGNISGNGISMGTVSYSSGFLSIALTVVPAGISGKYGVPIMCTFQYKGEAIREILEDADTDAGEADTGTDTFSTQGNAIDGYADDSDDSLDKIDEISDDIDAEANNSQTIIASARNVPDQIQNDIDDLSEYLDEMLSDVCKANIVRVSCLVLDSEGFYTAPTEALKQDLKTYLDERKIVTVQNSVVGGEFYLVKAKLNIEVKILPLFVFQTVSALIEAAIDEMFKGRDYKQPLLRSEYYSVIDAIDGVDYHNTTISDTDYVDTDNTGTAPVADSDGNLFVGDYEVITKWDVTITQIEE